MSNEEIEYLVVLINEDIDSIYQYIKVTNLNAETKVEFQKGIDSRKKLKNSLIGMVKY